MPLGYDRQLALLNLGDSAELYAYIFDREDQPEVFDEDTTVVFVIQRPDGTEEEEVDGEIQADGGGFLRYTDTDLPGEYRVMAKFTLPSGQIKSSVSDFTVVDPFSNPIPANQERLAVLVWDKLEDLFDSSDGGPWMRDMTLNIFGPAKIPDFFDEALLEINVYNPPTHFEFGFFVYRVLPDLENFPDSVEEVRTNEHTQILVLGTFLAVVRHLMRTYVEQPLPTGGQITYEDRRDYLMRWGTIYQIEWQRYDGLLKLWKRQFLDMNQGKLLVSSKAGRLLPAPLRTRNIGRGYY